MRDHRYRLHLLLLCLLTFALTLTGCGASIRVEAQDAHDVIAAASDCIDTLHPNANVQVALLECGNDARLALTTLCVSGVIPANPVCDAVIAISGHPKTEDSPTVDTPPSAALQIQPFTLAYGQPQPIPGDADEAWILPSAPGRARRLQTAQPNPMQPHVGPAVVRVGTVVLVAHT